MKLMFAALAASALVAAPAAAQPAGKPAAIAPDGIIPIALFAKRPFMQGPRISPDGTRIVVQMSKDKKGFLGIIDLSKPAATPDFFIATTEFRDIGDRTVTGWYWVGNDNVIVTMASRELLYGQRYDVTRVVGYNVKSKKLTPLAWDHATGHAADVMQIDHDTGSFVLQRQSDAYGTERWQLPEVVRVDVATGRFTILQRPNPLVGQWLIDGKGVVRAGLGYDETSGKERLMYRSNGDEQFRTVANAADSTFTSANIVPSIFLDEPDQAIALSNKDGYRKVYKVDMSTMTLGPVLFERPGYDVESGLYANEAHNKLIGVGVVENGDRDFWFDPDRKAIQANMDEVFGAGNAHLVSHDRKDEKVIFFVGAPSQPGAFYLYDTSTGKLGLIGRVRPEIGDVKLNPMSTIVYTARDGLKIHAVVTMPRHRLGQKNLPVVVMPHGGPFGDRDDEEFGAFPWHQALAEQGYVVIQPNYRGSGGYGKDFILKGRAPEGYGGTMQDDLNDAVAYFASQGIVDPKRACIMGWSYGGYATARGAQRDPGVWRCAIAGAGIYDLPMMKAYDYEAFGKFGARYQATAANLADISPGRHVEAKWSPILIVAGVRDQRIPIEQPHTVVARLKGAGKRENEDFRYVEQPEGTHNLPYEDVAAQWLEEANKWLARWNPAYVPTDADRPPAAAAARAGQ